VVCNPVHARNDARARGGRAPWVAAYARAQPGGHQRWPSRQRSGRCLTRERRGRDPCNPVVPCGHKRYERGVDCCQLDLVSGSQWIHGRMLTRFFRTYDVYKRYINPAATEAQILRMSHWMVLFYAVFMGLAGLIFYYIGISMGWLYVRELYCLSCDLLTLR
jgi:hypothetical protein